MNTLIVLVVLVGAAAAAPQAIRGAFRARAYPYQAPGYPYSAPGYPYAPAAYPYARAGYPYSAPAPAIKPYAAPAPYNPQYPTPYVAIVRQSQDDNFDGSFSYDFESQNGIAAQASGFVKNAGSEAEAQVIQGQFSYTSPEGTPIVTNYIADETGFHAEGSHIPKAPVDPYRIA